VRGAFAIDDLQPPSAFLCSTLVLAGVGYSRGCSSRIAQTMNSELPSIHRLQAEHDRWPPKGCNARMLCPFQRTRHSICAVSCSSRRAVVHGRQRRAVGRSSAFCETLARRCKSATPLRILWYFQRCFLIVVGTAKDAKQARIADGDFGSQHRPQFVISLVIELDGVGPRSDA